MKATLPVQCGYKAPVPQKGDVFEVTHKDSYFFGMKYKVTKKIEEGRWQFGLVSDNTDIVSFYHHGKWSHDGILHREDLQPQETTTHTDDSCPKCGARGQWLALARKCPECWFVW